MRWNTDVRSESTNGRITVVLWFLGVAGLAETWVFSGSKAAVVFAVAYLGVFIPGRLLLTRRQRH